MVKNFDWYWEEIRKVFQNDAHMIDHTQRVFDYTRQIVVGQPGMNEEEKRITALAALLHDIGILESEKKYHSRSGKYQHVEGPPLARMIMIKAGEPQAIIDRVAYIVGNHHHFSKADGIDFQIMIEADMLVNLRNETIRPDKLATFIEKFFNTQRGRELAKSIYLKK